MRAHRVIPAIASVVSVADAAGYGWWVAGLDVDWETVHLATFDREMRTRWNGMKPEERAKLNAEAAEAIAVVSREVQWMKCAEAEDRDRERLVSPPWSPREREEMERAVAREVKG